MEKVDWNTRESVLKTPHCTGKQRGSRQPYARDKVVWSALSKFALRKQTAPQFGPTAKERMSVFEDPREKLFKTL